MKDIKLMKSYEDFDPRDMADAEHMLESIRNSVESMLYYIRDEAELDVMTLDDYRINCGDIGDEIFALKCLFDKFVQPYRNSGEYGKVLDEMIKQDNS